MSLLLDRLRDLEQEFERRDALSDELMRYFPVAIVACLEGFFREIIRELIDHGPPYSDRIDEIENSRIDMYALKAIHGRTITVGEFIAHQVSLSSFDKLLAVMEKLLGDSFIKRLQTVRTAWSVHLFGEDGAPPSIGDTGSAVAGVKEAFRLRHILAHELATAYPIDRATIEDAFNAVSRFIYATDEMVNQLLYPDEQGAQADLTQAAARRFNAADEELQAVVRQIENELSGKELDSFRDVQSAWAKVRQDTAELHAWIIAEGGTLGHQMYYGMMAAMTRNRVEELRFLGGGLPRA